MKAVTVALSILLLLSPLSVPAHADFKYTNSTQMTGGSLYGMMKFAARFTKKGAANPLDPVANTYYIKGGRMRTDNPDGMTQIIDLEDRRVIQVNTQNKTYSVATFDEIKDAMQKAMQQFQQMQQAQPQTAQPAPKPEDVQLTLQPKIEIIPGTGSRVVMGQPTNETTMKMDMNMQAQANGQAPGATPDDPTGAASATGQQTVSATMVFSMDMFIAPSVPGFQEIGEFYKRMAQEINWTPPSNIHFDPRMEKGMEEFQKNSGAMKGLPMLEYITMGMELSPEQQAQLEAAQKSQQTNNSNSSASSSTSSRNDSIPTTPSAMIAKGLGGMFSKKKQQQQDSASSPNGSGPAANSDNPSAPANPGALIQMTVQVTSYSDSPLDRSIFEIPAGFTELKVNPDQVLSMGKGPKT
jgi:hypothetical protein